MLEIAISLWHSFGLKCSMDVPPLWLFFFPKNTVYVRFLVARKIDFVCAQISSDYLQMTMMSTVCKGEGDLEVVCMVLLFKR